jgi:hypothetical protein
LIGRVLNAATGLSLGALSCAQPPLAALPVAPAAVWWTVDQAPRHGLPQLLARESCAEPGDTLRFLRGITACSKRPATV